MLEFFLLEGFETLAQELVIKSAQVLFLETGGLDVVFKGFIILLDHEVAIRSVQVHQRVDILILLNLLNDLAEELQGGFGLTFHQEDHTFCEHLVVIQLFELKPKEGGSFKVIVSLIEVPLLNSELGDLIESRARKVLILT
jgi:hypothetical protein